MKDLITNFYEIFVHPTIDELFLTDRSNLTKNVQQQNLVTNFNSVSVLSVFPIDRTSKPIAVKSIYIEWLVKKIIFEELNKHEFSFDLDYKTGEVTFLKERIRHRNELSILTRAIIRVFSAYGKTLLAVDPITKIYNRISLASLLRDYNLPLTYFINHHNCLALVEKDGQRHWKRGKIIELLSSEKAKIEVPSLFSGTIEVSTIRIIPSLSKAIISSLLKKNDIAYDFDRDVKTASSFSSKKKLQLIESVYEKYLFPLFPINIGIFQLSISNTPVDVSNFELDTITKDEDTNYVITRNKQKVSNAGRLMGLSKFNLPEDKSIEHKVVLLSTKEKIGALETLVEKLNNGFHQGNFKMSLPSKFGIKLIVTDKFIAPDYHSYFDEIDKYIQSDEEEHQNSLPIIYLPPLSELYYQLKAKLAHYGKASQVISQPITEIYPAWNLATNLYAKLGYTPWAIEENPNSPNADIVLGLASSVLKREGKLKRSIGYVNVFDRNGAWQLIKSSGDYFDFNKRLRLLPKMIRNAIIGYTAGKVLPKVIDIHYTKSFSWKERQAIYDEILNLIDKEHEINFISIDKTHSMRVFDKSNTNWNFGRGEILQLSPNEFLMSIASDTSFNSLASRILKVRVWSISNPPNIINIHAIAYRILAMSKLNWRSAVKETSEPATLRFAEEIARLTNQFSLTEWETVNNQLSDIPWFI